MKEFVNENDLASHHYARRLISTSFGHWIQLVSENARIEESSMAKADSYLRRKSRNSPHPPEESLAMRRGVIRWMNYCNDQLKHRGQHLLGRIARQKLLIAKGYRRLRQFYVDEISMRHYGITQPLSTQALSTISGNHLYNKSRKMKCKFLRILREKCIRKNSMRQKLCQLTTENSPRLRNGYLALAYLKQWRRITQTANDNQTAFRQAIKHKKEFSLWAAFGKCFSSSNSHALSLNVLFSIFGSADPKKQKDESKLEAVVQHMRSSLLRKESGVRRINSPSSSPAAAATVFHSTYVQGFAVLEETPRSSRILVVEISFIGTHFPREIAAEIGYLRYEPQASQSIILVAVTCRVPVSHEPIVSVVQLCFFTPD